MLIRSVILFLFSLVIIISFSQNDEKNPSTYLKEYRAFDKIYQEAEKLSLLPGYNNKTEELEEQMNQQALDGFKLAKFTVWKDYCATIITQGGLGLATAVDCNIVPGRADVLSK